MRNEIVFKTKRMPEVVLIVAVLILELLMSSKIVEYYSTSNFVDLFLQQLIVAAIFVPAFWLLQKHKALRFYDDGISYISFFSRRFLRWDEIERIKVFENNHGTLYELFTGSKKIIVTTTAFKDKDAVLIFLGSRVVKISKNHIFLSRIYTFHQ